ncbi:MAG: exodeoxyribonuclease III [Clostridia bacterium]|nr:exodeoxyribonuclease III [Clostridia bacterium]
MRAISWNVNGLRACVKKGFVDVLKQLDADFFAVQEIKLQEGQIDLDIDGYYKYWHYAKRKGYSGTAIFAKKEPISVRRGFDFDFEDDEGRLLTLEYEDFYFITVYTPNAQPELKRLDFRMDWEDNFRKYLNSLKEKKSVIVCGDLNVAANEIDLKNPKTNVGNPGFSNEERAKFQELLKSGFIDTFRHLYPDKEGIYSWWSYRFNARANNAGWRIDYFLVSDDLKNKIDDSIIHTDIYGSDHCPVELILDK